MINKTELKIEQNELDKKPKVNLDAPKDKHRASLMAPVMLLLSQIRW